MELGQIYELQNDTNNAIEYYRNSYSIWEKILQESHLYEVFVTLSIKLAELYEKVENYQNAYEILKRVFYLNYFSNLNFMILFIIFI